MSVVGCLLAKDESLGACKEQRNAIVELLFGGKVSFIASIMLMQVWRCCAVRVEYFGYNLSGFLGFRFIASYEYLR